MKFVATKKGLTTNFFSPLSFVAVFGSRIRDPGSGIGKNQDPGSAINIPDPQHWYFERECVTRWFSFISFFLSFFLSFFWRTLNWDHYQLWMYTGEKRPMRGKEIRTRILTWSLEQVLVKVSNRDKKQSLIVYLYLAFRF